jgi:hypothetical protein
LVGPQDQRSLIDTFNIAPSRTHFFNDRMLFSLNTFVRQDRYHYYPSANMFADYLATLGMDNLFRGERCIISLTNKVALYNIPVDVQRHALHHPSYRNGRARVSLLARGRTRCGRYGMSGL